MNEVHTENYSLGVYMMSVPAPAPAPSFCFFILLSSSSSSSYAGNAVVNTLYVWKQIAGGREGKAHGRDRS